MTVQEQNKEHVLLHQANLLPLSDRNIFYQRTGDATTQTFTTGTITVQLDTETFDFDSFAGVFTWDAVNQDLTIDQSGLYLFYGAGLFSRNSGAGDNAVGFYLEEDSGAGFATVPGSIVAVPLLGSYAATAQTQMIALVAAGSKYRLRAYRLGGADEILCSTQNSCLMAVCLIGTPDS